MHTEPLTTEEIFALRTGVVPENTEPFREWCAVTLLDYTKTQGQPFYGLVTTVKIGDMPFLRLDIPAAGEEPEHTLFFGPQAIRSLRPMSEEHTRAYLRYYAHP